MTMLPLLSRLPSVDPDTRDLIAVIETPKGSPNKYKFEQKFGAFVLNTVMPKGSFFPYDFGFIPSTLGEDGDPLDVLVFMDDPAPVGCLVAIRLVGAIEAEQREENGETKRNDRLLAVAIKSPTHANINDLDDLQPSLLDEVETFFITYTGQRGKKFRPIGLPAPVRLGRSLRRGGSYSNRSNPVQDNTAHGARTGGRSTLPRQEA
jgi:inorganic pyrophosphatase